MACMQHEKEELGLFGGVKTLSCVVQAFFFLVFFVCMV